MENKRVKSQIKYKPCCIVKEYCSDLFNKNTGNGNNENKNALKQKKKCKIIEKKKE
jgi:hypothetical protein